jgi:circadian clock protein KaiC
MAHSNQVREFVMTKKGIQLLPVYVGGGTVLTGSARLSQEAREKAADLGRQQETAARLKALEGKRKALEARVAALRAEFAEEEGRVAQMTEGEEQREKKEAKDMAEMISLRASRRIRPDGRA